MEDTYIHKDIICKDRKLKLKLKLKSHKNKKYNDIKAHYNISRMYRCYTRGNITKNMNELSDRRYSLDIMDIYAIDNINMPKIYKKTKTWWDCDPYICSVKKLR
jgi:hypothetical protein